MGPGINLTQEVSVHEGLSNDVLAPDRKQVRTAKVHNQDTGEGRKDELALARERWYFSLVFYILRK